MAASCQFRRVPVVPASTFADVLAGRLARDPGQPLVTFYDDATGERVELSVATYANWVAKTAGLLQDELDVGGGGTVLVDLPTHWLGPVWLGAAWTAGLGITDQASRLADVAAVVCGPGSLASYAAAAAGIPVVALSLRPLGAPFTDPLPASVVDYAEVVPAQPDVFVAADPVSPEDTAWHDAAGRRSHRQLVEEGTSDRVVRPGGRLLTDLNACTGDGVRTLLGPLARDGSTVWVRHPDPDRWAERAAAERVTDQVRAQPPRS
jgi:uncharacterized protein (TIGR03089 family)